MLPVMVVCVIVFAVAVLVDDIFFLELCSAGPEGRRNTHPQTRL